MSEGVYCAPADNGGFLLHIGSGRQIKGPLACTYPVIGSIIYVKYGGENMVQTGFDEVKKVCENGDYRLVPIKRELYADIETPVNVLRKLLSVSKHCFLLESVEKSRRMGRYTFLGYDPVMQLSCTDGVMTINAGGRITVETKDPGKYIRQVISDNRSAKMEGFPTFTGGLAGYFSYDCIRYGEKKLQPFPENPDNYHDLDLMLFDKLICFDNVEQKLILIANVKTDSLEVNYNRALLKLDEMEKLVKEGTKKNVEKGRLLSNFKMRFSKEEYCRRVNGIKKHIKEGDIFQLVFSNPVEAQFTGSLLDTYRELRRTNPSPYMFYFSGDDVEMAGASPETLVKVTDGEVRTFPLAGTRPRGKDPADDKRIEKELLADEKERAEHNMLVDLGRNDLGKICKFGSVEVEKYMEIERFSQVMHIGSEVKGELAEGKDALDAIASALPAGTLSGAPKIRAAELIDKFEGDRRGIYGGAIGYLDFTGNMDVCIAIRFALKKNEKVIVRSGAGIVADSVPENEFMECRNKAKAVILAIKEACREENV